MSTPEPWRAVADGIEIAVRVTAKAGRDAVEGVRVDAGGTPWLQVRLRAAPERGRANEALARLLAKTFGVPPSAVVLRSGAGSRNKRLLVEGDPVALRQRAVALWRERGASGA